MKNDFADAADTAQQEQDVQQALDEEFDNSDLPALLESHRKKGAGFVTLSVGDDTSDLGDIEKTQAFMDFRSKMMATIPGLHDVRAGTKLGGYRGGEETAAVTFYLKEPTPLLRARAYMDCLF